MKRRKRTQKTDILWMHADDEATIRYRYTASELQEALLLHILYCGRVLIPLPYVLANPEFDDLFRVEGTFSEKSEIYELVKTGDIVPTFHDKRFSQISDYARSALDEGMIIHCTPDEFLNRAELLDEFSFALPSRTSGILYKDVLLGLLTKRNIQEWYFGQRYLKEGRRITDELVRKLRPSESVSRSDVYRFADQIRFARSQTAIKQIADAAYYATITDQFNASPAVPSQSNAALLVNYAGTDGPIVFTTGEDIVSSAPLPDFSGRSITGIVKDLRNTSSRLHWLKTFRNGTRNGQIDLLAPETKSAIGHWSQFLFDYLQKTGPKQRKEMLSKERRLRIRSTLLDLGEVSVATIGIVDSALGLVQGRPPITGLTLFALAASPVAIGRFRKRLASEQPVYGSGIPIRRTFTVRGQRYG